MSIRNLNLKSKLVIGVSLTTAVGLISLATASYLFTRNLVKKATAEKLEAQIEGIGATIKLSFGNSVRRAELSLDRSVKRVMPRLKVDPAHFRQMEAVNQVTSEKIQTRVPGMLVDGNLLQGNDFVDRLSEADGNVVTIFVRIPEGLLRVSTSVFKSDGERAVGTFIPNSSAVAEKLFAGERFIGRVQVVGAWYIGAYQPLVQNGQVVGAFFSGNPEQNSSEIKDHLKAQKIFETGYFFILDHEGRMLMHPKLEGKVMSAETDLDGNPIFKKILEEKNGLIEYRWLNAQTQQAQQKVALFRYFPEFDWYLAASYNKSEAEAVLWDLKSAIVSITLVAMLAMIGISFAFGHAISKSLQRLSDRLLQMTEKSSLSSSELFASSRTLSSSASDAATSLQQTAAAIEQINSQVKNNLGLAEETNQLGKNSLQTAQSSGEKLKHLNQLMTEIEKDSRQIQEVSTLIDDIAFQTNLLSLNAAVEAARAGEHGKSFAVVAEAVNALAARSADSAKQITRTVNESSERIQSVVAASRDVNQAFAEIVNNTQRFSQLVGEITVSSEEQTAGISQINAAVNQLNSTTESNSQAAGEIADASHELEGNTSELGRTVVELNQLIQGKRLRKAA